MLATTHMPLWIWVFRAAVTIPIVYGLAYLARFILIVIWEVIAKIVEIIFELVMMVMGQSARASVQREIDMTKIHLDGRAKIRALEHEARRSVERMRQIAEGPKRWY